MNRIAREMMDNSMTKSHSDSRPLSHKRLAKAVVVSPLAAMMPTLSVLILEIKDQLVLQRSKINIFSKDQILTSSQKIKDHSSGRDHRFSLLLRSLGQREQSEYPGLS